MSRSIVDLLSSQHIGNQGGGFEPQRYNSIMLVIPDIPGASASGEELSLALQSFTIPTIFGQQNTIQIMRGLVAKKFAGNLQFPDLAIDFKDYVDRATAETIAAWRARVFNPVTLQVNAASVYKRNCEIFFVHPGGIVGRSILVDGLWPAMGPEFGNADLANEDSVNIATRFEYDFCRPGRGFDKTSFSLSAGISFSVGGSASVGATIGGSVNVGLSGGIGGGISF